MNTHNKITVKENKILKLNNVLVRELSQSEFIDTNKIIHMIDNFIKTKGNSIVGPMINYSSIVSEKMDNLK